MSDTNEPSLIELAGRLKTRFAEEEKAREEERKEALPILEDYKQANPVAIAALATFSLRELKLIQNCISYTENDPHGLPGHNIMIIVDKLVKAFGLRSHMIETYIKAYDVFPEC